MNKFKIGDKVRFTSNTEVFLIGDEGIVVRVDDDGEPRLRMNILEGKLVSDDIKRYGLDSIMELVVDKKVEKKDQKQLPTTPLCYAEEQEKIQEELNSKSEEIEGIFSPEAFDGQVVFSEGEFNIDGVFDITQAKALKKWLTKMTATPKNKVVKKVAKKKVKAVK